MRRVAFSMTIDPDGAMHDWVDLPDGWAMTRVPTQEAVHLVGAAAYQEILVEIAERERPDVLVVHPPYDHLTEAGAARIRAAGTALVGWAFDDEIFAGAYSPSTRAALARMYDRYATTREVRWATAPLPALPERAPEWDAALVGRAYPRRAALVEKLRAAGLRVATRGLGWPEGFVSRAGMLDLYARAAVVITTADWEHLAVPMVKHRLLDAAMLGAFQVAQAAPDLRGYFSAEEVPSFADADELLARVREALADPVARRERARRARARALAEHTWARRFPELIAPLALAPERAPTGRARLLDQILLALASRAEASGRTAAAAALWREALGRDPDQPTALAGLGRCLRDLGDPAAALPLLARAAAAPTSPTAAALHCTLPAFGVGVGLGRLGLFPPAAEPTVFRLAALLELRRLDEAAALLDGIDDPALGRAVAAAVTLDDDPAFAGIRARLARFSL